MIYAMGFIRHEQIENLARIAAIGYVTYVLKGLTQAGIRRGGSDRASNGKFTQIHTIKKGIRSIRFMRSKFATLLI